LLNLIEAQCNYHHQAKDLLEAIKSKWGQGSTSDPREMMGTVMARTASNESYPSISEVDSHHYATSSIIQQPQRTPESSTDDYSTTHNYSTESIHQQQQPPTTSNNQHLPPVIQQASLHEKIEKYRKALFDFTGQNDDVIAVINEIDKGWWLGEFHNKRGIFPVNYTEEYDPQTHPLPPLPPSVNNPVVTSLPRQQSRESLNTHHSLPVATSNSTDATMTVANNSSAAAAIRRPPPPPCTSSSVIPTATNKQTGSLLRTKSTAIRPPPPPPATPSVNSFDSSSNSSNPLQDSPKQMVHDIKPTDESLIYQQNNTSVASSLHSFIGEDSPYRCSSPLPQDLPCNECECHEFIENLFKKGYCNNCFHKHHE
jgi:hypothetical protein